MEEKEKLYSRAMGPCQHEKITRYGNRHGRYSRCEDCSMRWKWDDNAQKWVEPPARGSQRLPLPLPSSCTAVTFEDKRFTPALRMGLTPPSRSSTPALVDKDRSATRSKSMALKPKTKRAVEEEPSEIVSDDSFEWDKVDNLDPRSP